MPSLILLKSPGGQGSRQTYPLTRATVVIGREETCDVVVPNNAVSRRHAQIIQADGQFILEDLKSRNKTYLNNREVAAGAPLKNDDKIKICDFLFLFNDDRAAARRPAPLPQEFGRDSDAGDDVPFAGEVTTVQSTVAQSAAKQLLDAQPSERLRALLDISTTLTRTLELDPLLPQIADTLFGVFRQADRCLLIMRDDAGHLIPKAIKGRRPGRLDEGFSKTIVRKCLESMQGYLTEDASAETTLAAAHSVASLQIRSVMCVPMATADGQPLGVIQLDSFDFHKRFTEDDLKLLTIVANLASASVEKAGAHAVKLAKQKQEYEIDLARTVQLGFLPQTRPEVAEYEFFDHYSAALTIGGDYYDYVQLPDGRVAVVLGDVAGKGVPASLLMAKLSAEARFSMLTESCPAKAVSRLNDLLIRGGIGDRFVTLAALVIDPNAHTLAVVNAGHINPLRFRPSSGAVDEIISDAQSGIPLGIAPGFEYESVTIPVAAGDVFALFTDGVTDAVNQAGKLFELARVREALADEAVLTTSRPTEVGDRLVKAVQAHAGGQPQSDDIAVVCVGRLDGTGPATSKQTGRIPMPDTRPIRVGESAARPSP